MANYVVQTDDGLTKWWFTEAGSGGRLSDLMDDQSDGPYLLCDGTWTNSVGNEWTHTVTTIPDGTTAAQDVYDVVGTAWLVFNGGGAGSLNAGEWDHSGSTLTVRLFDDSDPNASDPKAYYDWSSFMTEHVADGMYQIHKTVEAGDDSTTSSLLSTLEMVYLDTDINFTLTANSTLTLGVATTGGGKEGASWFFKRSASQQIWMGWNESTAVLNIYDSLIIVTGAWGMDFRAGSVDIRASKFVIHDVTAATPHFSSSIDSLDLDRVTFSGSRNVRFDKTPDSINDIRIDSARYGLRMDIPTTVTKPDIINSAFDDYYVTGVTANTVNPVQAIVTADITNTNAVSILILKYTINIHITDSTGLPIADSATVTATWDDIIEGDDAKTYRCTTDHTSVADANDGQPPTNDGNGNWTLIDASSHLDGLGGTWAASVAYKSADQEFSVSTTSGDIAEQTVESKRWTGTSEVLRVRVYKFAMSKAGYETLVLENITVSSAIDWHLELQDKSSGGIDLVVG